MNEKLIQICARNGDDCKSCHTTVYTLIKKNLYVFFTKGQKCICNHTETKKLIDVPKNTNEPLTVINCFSFRKTPRKEKSKKQQDNMLNVSAPHVNLLTLLFLKKNWKNDFSSLFFSVKLLFLFHAVHTAEKEAKTFLFLFRLCSGLKAELC